MRVWRIPYSTHCERVALAAASVGTPIEWVDVDVYDRSVVQELSGQPAVPIAELDGRIVAGSLEIVARIAPGLWPAEARARAEADIFVDWFERVWKQALGVVYTEADEARVARAGRRLEGYVDRFEALLDGREYLLGDELGIADVTAYPFVKYAVDRTPGDDYDIHDRLRRYQPIEGRPRVAAWLARVSTLAQ